MPVIFLFSAIISGVALLILLYVVSCWLRRVRVDLACLKGLGYAMWGFMMFALLLELVEFGAIIYRGREGIEVIEQFITGPLLVPYFILQLGVGAATPILILAYMFWRGTAGRTLLIGVTLSALLVVFSVLMMRYNVVIGGQEISKTGKGLLTFPFEVFGKDGLIAAASVLIAPLILLAVMVRLLPPWHDPEPENA